VLTVFIGLAVVCSAELPLLALKPVNKSKDAKFQGKEGSITLLLWFLIPQQVIVSCEINVQKLCYFGVDF